MAASKAEAVPICRYPDGSILGVEDVVDVPGRGLGVVAFARPRAARDDDDGDLHPWRLVVLLDSGPPSIVVPPSKVTRYPSRRS